VYHGLLAYHEAAGDTLRRLSPAFLDLVSPYSRVCKMFNYNKIGCVKKIKEKMCDFISNRRVPTSSCGGEVELPDQARKIVQSSPTPQHINERMPFWYNHQCIQTGHSRLDVQFVAVCKFSYDSMLEIRIGRPAGPLAAPTSSRDSALLQSQPISVLEQKYQLSESDMSGSGRRCA
jgi:hypothetical protein